MDVRVLILLCFLANILQNLKADDSEESEEDDDDRHVQKLKICASDLKTHILTRPDQLNTELFLIRRGKCPTRQQCHNKKRNQIELCGSDGKTYTLCELIKNKPEGITVVSRRPCVVDGSDGGSNESGEVTTIPSRTTNPTHVSTTGVIQQNTTTVPTDIPPNTTMNIEILTTKNEQSTIAPATMESCMESCPLEFNPVCGTDGATYPSLCVLNAIACTSNPDLDLDYFGQCAV